MPRPSTPPELVIFDCDGILVDSEPIALRIDALLLRRVGLEMSEAEIIDRFVGRSADVMDAAIAQHLGQPLPAELRREFDQLYQDAFEAELRPVPGIEDALARISAATCVASSSEPASLRHKLALCGLLDRFDGRIFSGSQVERGKPAPDLFLLAAERMSTSPRRSVVVEDSQYGVRAARAAGMRVLAYTGGLTPAGGLGGNGVVTFEDMRRLPDLLAAI